MALHPLLLSLIDELERETYNPFYYGQDFGLGLHPQHLQRRPEGTTTNALGYALPLSVLAERQLVNRNERKTGAVSSSAIGKDGFQVCMDVTQFKPNELLVKVVDNCVVVEGKHEEREDDHGYIARQFVRRYALPKDYDPEQVISTLSSDGVLTVSVPKPQAIQDAANERIVQIQQTGPAHLNVKQNANGETNEAAASDNGNGQ